MKKTGIMLLLALGVLWSVTMIPPAFAAYSSHQNDQDVNNFLTVYPFAKSTKLDDCSLCHPGGNITQGGKTSVLWELRLLPHQLWPSTASRANSFEWVWTGLQACGSESTGSLEYREAGLGRGFLQQPCRNPGAFLSWRSKRSSRVNACSRHRYESRANSQAP